MALSRTFPYLCMCFFFPPFHFAIIQASHIVYKREKWRANDEIASITTIIALLALHIESALDPTETDLVRSMAQISISQTMLVLTQGKEIPALKRALPLFEEILDKKNLYLVPPSSVGQIQDKTLVDADASLHMQAEQYENNPLLYDDFLGFDLLDEWQIGQMDFIG